MASSLTIDQSAPVLNIALDDGAVNALTLETVVELNRALDQAIRSKDISVVILQGNEKALTVGLDTETVLKQDENATSLLNGMRSALEKLYLSRLRSIVIAEGHATAAGAMLLLVADKRLGVEGPGKIGLSEVRVGLSVPPLTQQLVRDRIAVSAHYETTALAHLTSVQQAKDIGFLDDVFPDRASALAAAHEFAVALAALDETAYLETKRGMRQAFSRLLAAP